MQFLTLAGLVSEGVEIVTFVRVTLPDPAGGATVAMWVTGCKGQGVVVNR